MTIIKNSKRLAVYFPTEFKKEITSIPHLLADYFQGASMYEIDGTWKDIEGNYIDEKITVIYSLYDTMKDSDYRDLLNILSLYKISCRQESVMIEKDRELILIWEKNIE